jgi:anaerobic magnesium-protoporphyrin IX monomethyl ester cyclase
MPPPLFQRVLFLICPTGSYCREDRCQSFFDPKLIPAMRPPLEECEAAGAIHAAGAHAYVIDAPAMKSSDEEVLRNLTQYNPDLIILSVTFGSLAADLRWAKRLKASYPNTPLGLRGAPCYVQAENLLAKHTYIDFCARGDYEVVLSAILRSGIENAAGVVARSCSGVTIVNSPAFAENLDELPFPDRSCINQALYRARFLGKPQATVRVQRGCPFPCTYCLVHTVSGKKARHRSVAHIIREVRALMKEGIRYIYFRADTFSVNRAWTLELCAALARECPGVRWVTTTRAECVDDELLAAFHAAGCYGLSFGIDVASATIAERVRKPLLPDQAAQAMRLCDTHGIISLAYIMIGFIWDTHATLTEAQQFLKYIRPDLVTIHFAHPYPGTAYYEAAMAEGTKVVSNHAQAEPACAVSGLSINEIRGYGNKMLRQHYLRPAVLFSLAKKLLPGTATLRVAPERLKSHAERGGPGKPLLKSRTH